MLFARWVVDFLRERLADIKPSLTEDNNKNPLRIYISRAKARRKITNEGELFKLLAAEGFVKYHLEDLKVAEQIQLFKQAEVIVAAHGAGLTNLIFCKAKTKIFEIFQELEDSTFLYLSQIVGLQHQCIKTVPFKHNAKSFRSNTFIPLELIQDEIINKIKK